MTRKDAMRIEFGLGGIVAILLLVGLMVHFGWAGVVTVIMGFFSLLMMAVIIQKFMEFI